MEISETAKAEDFLDPSRFVTAFDKMPANVAKGLAREQYEEGLRVGRENARVTISARGTWSATRKLGHTQSYERIGYHACTADLLRGFLDSGVEIIVCRVDAAGGLSSTRIK